LRRREKSGFGQAVAGYFKESKTGLSWLLAVAGFEVISAWTNVYGLAVVLPWVAAVILGIAIQGAIVAAGSI